MSLMRKATVCLFMVVLVVEVFLFSCETLLANPGAGSVTRTYVIGASRDDAWSKFDDVKWDDAYYYLSKSDIRSGCRWSIDIPQGAVIEQAYFICKAKNPSQPGPKCRIQVFDQDSCDDFDVIFWDWAVMSGAVDWGLPTFTADAWYTSPDLKEIVQAFIDRPGYVSGNYLGLKFVLHIGVERGHEVWAWDDSASYAAKLEVTYTTGIPPIADFTYSPEAPIVGEAITFDASSSYDLDGTIVSYGWDFGDGTPEVTENDPFTIHAYTSWGTFTVTLNVTDSEGLWETESKQITVRGPPYADFTWSPTTPEEDETVTFDGSSSTPDGGVLVSWGWDFGDGSPKVKENDPFTTHVYASYGTYPVTLNVTDSENKWDIESEFITVVGMPHADFNWSPLSPQMGETVTFDASASTPDGGTITSYSWNLGDGSPLLTEDDPIALHTYSTYGTFTVTLNVTDSEGKWDTESKQITVRAHPIARFTWSPTTPEEDETVTFDGSSSTPDGGTLVSYEWDFGDVSPKVKESDPFTTHLYSSSGLFIVTLNVTDDESKWDIEVEQIGVAAIIPPKAAFTWTPTSPLVDETVTFDASASTPNGGTIISYTWDFGDGSPPETDVDPITTHKYSTYGTLTVTLNVTDSEGKWDTESKQITVTGPPCAQFVWSPTNPQSGETVSFDGSSSTPDGGTILSWEWDFGDATPSITESDPFTTHVYASYGTYPVTLNVTDSENKWDTESKSITVVKPPVASFTYSPTKPLVNETVTFNASSSVPNGGTIVSYLWDFDDGPPVVNETSPITTHNYTTAKTYNVTLTVTNSEGLSDSTSKLVKVRIPGAPEADFTYSPTPPTVGETIIFNASSSYDSDGFIANYTWEFGDGTNGIGVIASHIYTSAGTYNITLTVTDNENLTDSTSKFILIGKYPVASFTYSPLTPLVDEMVTLDASASTPNGGTIVNYIWNFGDGNMTGVTVPIITHIYTVVGTYNVTLTVTDDEGLNDISTMVLTLYVHDVTIVSVVPSGTEVYVGQVLNVSVVIRNKGNIAETFNVTLYYDGHAIGTQTVTGLEPETETTLKFSWGTTDVTPDVSYTIKAVASAVAGETDTVDNTYTYDNVSVKSQVTSPSIDWSSILPYLLPILLGALGLAVVGIVRNKREVGEGFEFFNEMTDGGIPDAYSVMIIGSAGSGKSVLCQQLAYNYLTEGKSCIYVTYDIFPLEVRQNMKNFQWDISLSEHEGAFVSVDCYSSIAGLGSEEKYHLEQPFVLSDLGIEMSTVMGEVKQKSPRVFLDSTTPLFTSLDPPKVMNFLRDRSAKIKGDNGIFFFTVGKDTVPSGLMHRLEGIVDCIIELDVHEEKGETLRKMRIKKLRGRRFADMWVPFKIELKRGITFLPPKDLAKKQKKLRRSE